MLRMRRAIMLLLIGCGSSPPETIAPHDAGFDARVAKDAAVPDPGRVELLTDASCFPFALALDDNNVYFTCAATGSVNRVPKLGGKVEVLASGRPHPHRIAVADGIIAWGDYGNPPYFLDGAVVTLPVSGGVAPTIVASKMRRIADIVWDAHELFFLENGTFTDHYFADGELWRAHDGVVTALAQNLNFPTRVALDATTAFVAIDYGGTIASCARAGCALSASTFAFGFDQPFGVAVSEGSLFFTEAHGGRVLKTPTKGGAITELEVSRGIPAEIVVDHSQMFWTEELTREVNRATTQGGTFDTLSYVDQSPSAIAVDATSVFFADERSGVIVRLPR